MSTLQGLPPTIEKWEEAVAEMGLTGQTIHGATLASASKFEYKHFLLLRVIYKTGAVNQLSKYLPDLDPWMSEAKAKLKTYTSWNTYCQGFSRPDIQEGNFAVARHYQLEVSKTEDKADPQSIETPIAHRTRARTKELATRFANMQLETPSKSTNISKPLGFDNAGLDVGNLLTTPSTVSGTLTPKTWSPFRDISPISKELENVVYPPTKDEQIVNCALVIFLNALTILFLRAFKWTLHRKAFKVMFGDAGYEARTDGYLDDGRSNPHVIIEVKPCMRAKNEIAIQMQEAAQMVAWIKSDGERSVGDKNIRLHLAQDRHLIYLTIAEYDRGYVDYLENKNQSQAPPCFMTMRQFESWDIRDANHMRNLGPILLAISLRAEAENRKNKS